MGGAEIKPYFVGYDIVINSQSDLFLSSSCPQRPVIVLGFKDNDLLEISHKLGVDSRLRTPNLGYEDVMLNIIRNKPEMGMTSLAVFVDGRRLDQPLVILGRCDFENDLSTRFRRDLERGFYVLITDRPRWSLRSRHYQFNMSAILKGGLVYADFSGFDAYVGQAMLNWPIESGLKELT